MFERLIREWDGEFVSVRFDAPTSAWMFVGVHSTALGPGFGGTRMKPYQDPEDALRDVLRLSAAMTSKNALAGLPFGGGKAVLAVPAVPQGEDRTLLLHRYADLVASLGGSYRTACDMNTTEADMDVIGERCPYVFGRTVAAGGSGSSAPATATGVFHGIRAGVAHAFGSNDLEGRTVLVQGVGAVGVRLSEMLSAAGAKLVLADVAEEKAVGLAERLGARAVPAGEAVETECDVFSPCATGGVLSARSIPRLRCRVVGGAANNQLGAAEDAARLHEAGILYAPDYAINAGGVLHLAGMEALEWTSAQLEARLAGIEDTLTGIFRTADAEGISTGEAAARAARARLLVVGIEVGRAFDTRSSQAPEQGAGRPEQHRRQDPPERR